MRLAEVPIETRVEAGVFLVQSGTDPSSALAAVAWPTSMASLSESTAVDFCRKGLHAMTTENTYTDPKGWRRCRECIAAQNRDRKKERERRSRKVPCAYCGEPATAPSDKGTGGLPTPRCRKCFYEQAGLHGRTRARVA